MKTVKTSKQPEFLENISRAMFKRGWLVMGGQWSKSVCKVPDGGHTTWRTAMYPREGSGQFILDVTVREGRVSLVNVYSKTECYLPSEI